MASRAQKVGPKPSKWRTRPRKARCLHDTIPQCSKEERRRYHRSWSRIDRGQERTRAWPIYQLVVQEVRFGTKKADTCESDLRKAEMLMFLARNEVISNPCHWHAFPPSPRTLWEVTQKRPKQRLLELIANGSINSAMTREEAVALRHRTSQGRS